MNFDFLGFLFSTNLNSTAYTYDTGISVTNPSTGLPMVESHMGGIDVGGSPFGMDVHSSMDDSFTDCMASNPWE